MSKADKMFEELGYEKSGEPNHWFKTINQGVYVCIRIDKEDKSFFKNQEKGFNIFGVELYLGEHLAIHEKMKELGWLND